MKYLLSFMLSFIILGCSFTYYTDSISKRKGNICENTLIYPMVDVGITGAAIIASSGDDPTLTPLETVAIAVPFAISGVVGYLAHLTCVDIDSRK